MNVFIDFFNDVGNYESRKVARVDPEDNGGIGVSTAYTSDEGFETALLDANGVHPVERYKGRIAAKAGHEKWVEFAKNADGKSVRKLFWSDFSDMDEDIVLESVSN
jgi:hypothetical protein